MSEMCMQNKSSTEENKNISTKNCGCNYTGSGREYPDTVRQKAIKYYLERVSFRKIERLIRVSRVSVIINRVKNLPKKYVEKRKRIKNRGKNRRFLY